MEDKFDVIIIGGGLAGLSAGYSLAKEGCEVLLIERGNFCGAKNMTGGRLYSYSIEEFFPDFRENAPFEREIVHEKISFMDEESALSIDYNTRTNASSYSVLRAKFDPWLAEKAEEAGCSIINSILVEDLIIREGKVCGVIASGEEMEADVVLLAEGANALLGQKLGLIKKPDPHNYAVGVKEVIELDSETINERFACSDTEGAAWLFAGYPSNNLMGGGFLYTNKTSVSLGVVFGLHSVSESSKSVPQMLEDFKHHNSIAPLIKGGKSVEYSAHIVPEGGTKFIPELVGDGVLLAGDSANFCLNLGYTIRGMDLAIESGKLAAKAIAEAKQRGDFSKASLSFYKDLLAKSPLMADMKLYENLPEFLSNPRMFSSYPSLALGVMHGLFSIDGKPSVPLRKKIMARAKNIGYINLLKDCFKGVKSI